MEGFTGDGGQSVPLARWRSNFSRKFQYYLDKSTPHPFYRWLGTSVAAIIYILRVYYVQGFYIVSYGLGIYVLNLLIGFLSPQVDPEIEGMDGVSLPTKGSDEFRPFVRRLPEFKFCLSMVILLLFYAIFVPDVLGRSLVNNIEWDIQITPQAVRDPDAYVARRNNINDNIPIVWSRVFVSIFPVTLMLFVDIIRYSITKAFCIAFLMTFFSVFDVPVFWPILLCYWVVLFVLTMKRQIMHMIKYKYVPFSVGKRRYSGKKPASDKASTSRE